MFDITGSGYTVMGDPTLDDIGTTGEIGIFLHGTLPPLACDFQDVW
jgi:hypothetical protein